MVERVEDNSFAPGDIIAGLEPSELVEIQRIIPFGGKMLVEGVGLQSRRMVKRPLTSEELASLVKVRGQQYTFDGDAGLFLLGAEAERIRIAHQFDPLFAVNSSIAKGGIDRMLRVILRESCPTIPGKVYLGDASHLTVGTGSTDMVVTDPLTSMLSPTVTFRTTSTCG